MTNPNKKELDELVEAFIVAADLGPKAIPLLRSLVACAFNVGRSSAYQELKL